MTILREFRESNAQKIKTSKLCSLKNGQIDKNVLNVIILRFLKMCENFKFFLIITQKISKI